MGLHDRHTAHHTLPDPRKQARQSLAWRPVWLVSEAFPYSQVAWKKSPSQLRHFVSFFLQPVT
jgi:hypothetical protein